MKKTVPLALAAIALVCVLVICIPKGEDNKTDSPKETQAPTTGSHISNHPFMDELYGQWEAGNNGYQKPTKLTYTEDGICTVEYSANREDPTCLEFIWSVDETASTENMLCIKISNKTRVTFIFQLTAADSGYAGKLTEVYEGGAPDRWYDYYRENENPALQAVLGEWILVDDDDAPKRVEFLKDNTCLLDGNSYLWKMGGYNAKDVNVEIQNTDGERLYYFNIHQEADLKTHYAYINMTMYAKPAQWERIDITPENLFDYYELVNKDFYFIKDDFGEYTRYSFTQELVLKEAYVGRDFQRGEGPTKIAMEIAYSLYNRQVELDFENLTGAFVGEPQLDSTSTRIYTFYSRGTHIWSCLRDVGSAMLYYDDIEILRTSGQLWLVKE